MMNKILAVQSQAFHRNRTSVTATSISPIHLFYTIQPFITHFVAEKCFEVCLEHINPSNDWKSSLGNKFMASVLTHSIEDLLKNRTLRSLTIFKDSVIHVGLDQVAATLFADTAFTSNPILSTALDYGVYVSAENLDPHIPSLFLNTPVPKNT